MAVTVTGLQQAPTHLALADIELGPNCRRDVGDVTELAASIRQVGVLQPLLVEPLHVLGDQLRGYGLVAGYRRYRAAEVAGVSSVPVAVIAPGLDRVTVNLVENLYRVDLSPIEKGDALLRMAQDCSQRELGARTGMAQGTVSRLLGYVTKLCPQAREALHAGRITQQRASQLLLVPADVQLRMLSTGTRSEPARGRRSQAEAHLQAALAAYRRGEEDAALVAAREAVLELERRRRDGRDLTPRASPASTTTRDVAERRAIARASTPTGGRGNSDGKVHTATTTPPAPRARPAPAARASSGTMRVGSSGTAQLRPTTPTPPAQKPPLCAQPAVPLAPAGQRTRQLDTLDDDAATAGRPKVKCSDCNQWLAVHAGSTAKKRMVAHRDLTGCDVATQLRALR